MYDERTLDRLAFIARAKQLGCSLEEITGLTTAWDGGQCGPIQDQLRQLVAAKIAAAQEQIADLMTFTANCNKQPPRSNGTDPTAPATPTAAASANPTSRGRRGEGSGHRVDRAGAEGGPAIACTLSPGTMKGRLADGNRLLAHVERREQSMAVSDQCSPSRCRSPN